MSNEYEAWRRDTVVELYLPLGWEVKSDPNDPFGEEWLEKNGLRLSLKEAFEIYFAFHNHGYDAALEHIKSKIDEELYDI